MTAEQLRVRRDRILERLGIAQQSFGEASVQYSDAAKALAVIDAELARIEAEATGGSVIASSYVSF